MSLDGDLSQIEPSDKTTTHLDTMIAACEILKQNSDKLCQNFYTKITVI